MPFKLRLSTWCAGLALGVASLAAHAQTAPTSIFVGFPPGGASDTLARLMADKLRAELDATVIVENRPGIGGRPAAVAVKGNPPNGRSILITPNSTGVFETLTHGTKVMGYDILEDLQTVARLTANPMVMVVNSNLGLKTTQEYLDWTQKDSSRAMFGTAGFGGDSMFYGLELAKLGGATLSTVPYRGNAPMLLDLVGGQIPAGVMVVADAAPHIQSGALTPLGVFTKERSPLLPDVPTFKEQGFDTGADNGWMGVWVAKGTPPATIAQLEQAFAKIMADPETQATIREKLNQIPDFRPAQQADADLRAEMATWGPVIKASGIDFSQP